MSIIKDQEPIPWDKLIETGSEPLLHFKEDSVCIYFRANLMDHIEREQFIHEYFDDHQLDQLGYTPFPEGIYWLYLKRHEPFPNAPKATHRMMPHLLPRVLTYLEEQRFDFELNEQEFELVQAAINGLRDIIAPEV